MFARKNIIIQLTQSCHYRRLIIVRLHFVEHGIAKKLQAMCCGMLDEVMKVNRPSQRIEIVVIKGPIAVFKGVLEFLFQNAPVEIGFFFRSCEKL